MILHQQSVIFQIVIAGQPSHAFSMAVFGDYLYITDWVVRALVWVNKISGGNLEMVRNDFDRQPMSVVVVSANVTTSACE